jgi:hypothetical protein
MRIPGIQDGKNSDPGPNTLTQPYQRTVHQRTTETSLIHGA